MENELLEKLKIAAKTGNMTELKYLFNLHGTMYIDEVIKTAISSGQASVVKYCFENGFSIELEFNDQFHSQVSHVDKAIQNGFNLCDNYTDQDIHKQRLLTVALKSRSNELLNYLFEIIEFQPYDILMVFKRACITNQVNAVEFLINKCNIKSVAFELLDACIFGAHQVVSFLTDHIDADKILALTLEYAAMWGMMEIITKIYENQAIDDEFSEFILNTAVEHGQTEVIKYLIAQGVSFNKETIKAIQLVNEYGQFDHYYQDIYRTAVIPDLDFLIDHIISSNPGETKHLAKYHTNSIFK